MVFRSQKQKQLTDIETVEEVIIPYSNHPAHFDRFIQDIGRMAKDDINLRTSLMTNQKTYLS